MKSHYDKAMKFIYMNARPLDLAIWKYHFENGSIEDILVMLKFYQNEDGGFGKALEPDSWDGNSSPAQTWAATEILREIGHTDKSHPIVQGILKYLESGKDFEGGFWCFTSKVPGEYPHAPWWQLDEKQKCSGSYNPTVSLAGFIIENAQSSSNLYKKAVEIVIRSAEDFIKGNITEMHTLRCFLQMFKSIERRDVLDNQTLEAFRTKLLLHIEKAIVTDSSKWNDYVCKPSFFIHSKDSAFYQGREDAVNSECRYILENQREDGSWDVTWDWNCYPDYWPVARNWWKSHIIISNLLFLRNFM